MNVDSNVVVQQMQMGKVDSYNSNQGYGRMMKETISVLPKEIQADIKSLMQTLDPIARKDSMKEMNEIESSNMSVEDLTNAIMDIFQPNQSSTNSSFPSSFSVYA